MPYRSVNPATGEVLKTFDQLKDDQVLSSLAAAENAFRGWAAWPFSERAKVIGTAARIMLERKEELSRSRPWKWVKGLLRVAAR